MSASERAHDKAGPRPENQRKRVELRGPRHALIGMLAVVAGAAITFAVMRRSDAGLLGLPPDYLRGASGLSLAGLIAITHVLAAVLLLIHAPRARLVAMVAGLVVVGSSVVLIMMMLGVTWLPAVLFFVGFVELLLVAGSTPRKEPHRKHVPGRR